MSKTVIWDCETDGLLREVSRIWVISLCILEGEDISPIYSYTGDEIDDAVGIIEEADVSVGHNVVGYDNKVLYKLYDDFNPKPGQIVRDTQVLSQMLFANQKDKDFKLFEKGLLEGKLIGRHGLEAWGQRLGHYKGSYAKDMEALGRDPWKDFDMEMGVPYCEDDIEVTLRLWMKIKAMPWSEESVILEHQITELMAYMEEDGFNFDVEGAKALEAEVSAEYEKLSAEAIAHFGSWYAPVKKYKGENRPQYGEDDSRTIWSEVTIEKRQQRRVRSKHPATEGVQIEYSSDWPYCKVELKDFNPNSRPQIIDRLQTIYNWEPVDFTEKGNPEVNDEVLRGLADAWPICETLAELFFLSKLLGQVADGENGWLKVVDDDGYIHGRTNAGGTRSGRASHSKPNVAQVPKVKVVDVVLKDGTINPLLLDAEGKPLPICFKEDGTYKKSTVVKGRKGDYGWECRSLFRAPVRDGQQWWLMGCDLKGIELRCFGHHLARWDNGAYLDVVLNGDVHTTNQMAAGLPTRDNAKTFIYACVPEDTQALTRRGWKYRHELIIGEDILTYNSSTGMKEWKPLLEVVSYDSAPVVEMKTNHHFAVRSTPNHRWFADRRTWSKRDYYQQEVVTTEKLNSEHRIIVNAPMVEDMNTGKYPNPLCLPKYGTNWTDVVLNMSHQERAAFLNGFMLADGHYNVQNGHWLWTQLRDTEITEALILATYLVHDKQVAFSYSSTSKNPMIQCRLSKKGRVTGQRLVKTELGDQPVWCVRTENESWVMRQGDVITITGNTLYGGGDAKIGSIVCPPGTPERTMKARGKELKAKFQEGVPAYRELMRWVSRQAKQGWMPGLDGRKLWVKSPHSALNLLLQSDGALLAKKWVCLYVQYMEEAGYRFGWDGDFVLCAWVHDEIQSACRTKEIAEHAALLAKKAALQAGIHFNYNSPIEADSKIGLTWSETH